MEDCNTPCGEVICVFEVLCLAFWSTWGRPQKMTEELHIFLLDKSSQKMAVVKHSMNSGYIRLWHHSFIFWEAYTRR